MLRILLVAIGGSIGAVSRYLISTWAAKKFGTTLPYGTLLVNVGGCFIIGAFMTLATEKFVISPYWRLLVTVGFLGGLTTFSSFSYETLKLLGTGNWQIGFYNVFLNIILGFGATWLGIIIGRYF